jgi:hypothetical protein
LANGKSWVDILNAYHTQSYFTGTRAVPSVFIQDAPLLPQWTFTYDSLDASQQIAKKVGPNSMQTFAFQESQIDNDTLTLNFQGDLPASSVTYPTWSASCILEQPNKPDSIAHFAFASNTLASLQIPSWKSFKNALVIVSNGDVASSHHASISIQSCPITYSAGSQRTFTVSTSTDTATIQLTATKDLMCPLTISAIRNDSLVHVAAQNQLFPVISLFDVSFPAIWSTGSSISLKINSKANVPAMHYSLRLYVWNYSAWSKVKDSLSFAGQSLHDVASINQPGIYSVFYSTVSTFDTANSVAVFPNPAHLKRDQSISFRGKSLFEIWIYRTDGMLLAHDVKGQNSQSGVLSETMYGFDWRLCRSSGEAVAPGVYFARIGIEDSQAGATKKQTQKVFVVP